MIPGRYTLFSRIPVFRDANGVFWADPLWQKDLALHFGYIEDLRLCCPVCPRQEDPAEDLVPVTGLGPRDVIALRRDGGWGSVVANLVPNFRAVLAAMRGSDIVHSDGAGWAFPLSFYILLLHPFLRRKWVLIIESSFWQKPADRRPTLGEWLRHTMHVVLLRRCVRRADAVVFTQTGYRRLLRGSAHKSLVCPAVWVDAAQVISESRQAERLRALPERQLDLLFAARLIPDKGVDFLFDLVRALEARLAPGTADAPRVSLTILGEGPLRDRCRDFAAHHAGAVSVRFLDPVPYGPAFFALVQKYHAVLLANRQNEQPRLIFDAFSQGVPVISSATDGVRDVVAEGRNALLYPMGAAQDCAGLVLDLARDRGRLDSLSWQALDAAQGRSHAEMHRHRAELLERLLVSPARDIQRQGGRREVADRDGFP